ncbi:MAG: hypothetical protein Q8K15_01865, partial [Candidatus Omnitrophota bacterium]|nr:hypothetical protein [Candidatus Omnitrophota bacterium]
LLRIYFTGIAQKDTKNNAAKYKNPLFHLPLLLYYFTSNKTLQLKDQRTIALILPNTIHGCKKKNARCQAKIEMSYCYQIRNA